MIENHGPLFGQLLTEAEIFMESQLGIWGRTYDFEVTDN